LGEKGAADESSGDIAGDIILTIPVNTNFTAYINYFHPLNICNVRGFLEKVDLYWTHGKRTEHAKILIDDTHDGLDYTTDYTTGRALSFNGEGFQVCIRFYFSTGYVPPAPVNIPPPADPGTQSIVPIGSAMGQGVTTSGDMFGSAAASTGGRRMKRKYGGVVQ
jgi:hypothetical protein